ncbi:MAG: hypothetical protein OXC91_09015 [Rhodobacteraceae bacterium]|nr:hypothetical protein [Paracoccaceae bacterium]
MCEGVPIAIYLQALSILIGIVAFAIPVAITIAGLITPDRFQAE